MCNRIIPFAMVGAMLAFASSALANHGTLLPLDQYQAGTEVTNLVPNGDFETQGSSADQPALWTKTGGMERSAPIGLNTSAVNGNFTAKAIGNSPGLQKYSMTIPMSSLVAGEKYRLSGYIWNYGLTDDIAQVEIMGNGSGTGEGDLSTNGPAVNNFSLQIGQGAAGETGYFGSIAFNADQYLGLVPPNTDLRIEVEFDVQELDSSARAAMVAQFDNIALTLDSVYRPPLPVPEPASLSLLGLSAALLRRRRI